MLFPQVSQLSAGRQEGQEGPQGQGAARGPRGLTHAEVGQRFARRLQMLRAACRQHANSSLFRHVRHARRVRLGRFPPWLNISLGYCPIQKTGSTTWAGLLRSIRRLMRRRGVKEEELEEESRAEGGVLFAFVREPYARLLSAYVDKLFCPNTLFWGSVGRYIVRRFRADPSEQSLRCGHDVTFPEFIRYFIHAQTTGAHRDGHFIPAHDHCDFCRGPYDYVGHLETLGEDLPYLLKAVRSPVNYSQHFASHTILDNAGWVLKRMRPRVRACMDMGEACRRLWSKWQIRGILSKAEPLPVTAGEAERVSMEAFVNRSLAALARSGPGADLKRQKGEALREAFSAVPLKDRLKVRELLFLDFALFGFRPDPDTVFPNSSSLSGDGGGYIPNSSSHGGDGGYIPNSSSHGGDGGYSYFEVRTGR